MKVRAKKQLGQHFLNDEGIAHRIVESLLEMDPRGAGCSVLEVGPGMGVLTKYLLQEEGLDFRAVEIDGESVEYLIQNYPSIRPRLYEEDFLRMDIGKIFPGKLAVIGNFPYNISSQIFFKILEHKDNIPFAVGMIQKEVADRLASLVRHRIPVQRRARLVHPSPEGALGCNPNKAQWPDVPRLRRDHLQESGKDLLQHEAQDHTQLHQADAG